MNKIDAWMEKAGNRWFFFGWLVVLTSFVSSMINSGTGSYAIGFFIVPMGEELGISRTQFSTIPLFKLATIPVLPLLGLLVDRKHGARIILILGTLVGGGALALTSQVNSLWQFYALYGVMYGFATAAMGSQLVGPALISKWFVRFRGRAMAIGTMGISAGGVLIAPLAGITVSLLGWRSSWVTLGAVAILAIVPLAILFIRRSPEDVGMVPDGESQNSIDTETINQKETPSWTLQQALTSRSFWILATVQTLGLCGLGPVLFHEIAYIQDKGFSVEIATIVAASLAASAMVSKLPFGYLADKMDIRKILAFCLIPAGLSTFLIIPALSVFTLIGWGILHGFFMGGFPTLTAVAFPEYFGRSYMGSIRGALSPATMVISASSPLIGGLLWTQDHSYAVAFVVFGIAWIVAGFLPLTLDRPIGPQPKVKSYN